MFCETSSAMNTATLPAPYLPRPLSNNHDSGFGELIASKSNMKRRRDDYEVGTSLGKRQCRRDFSMSKTMLACHFVKYDPIESHRCSNMAFENIARLKEHLRRTHLQPPSCPRCFEQFVSREDMKRHARALVPCEVRRAPPAHEGLWITEETYEKLSRRTKKGGDPAETWVKMYKTIFPKVCNDEIPSPFFDNRSDSVRLREHVMRDFTRYLRRKIPSSGSEHSVSTQSNVDGVVLDRMIEAAKEYIDDIGTMNAVQHDTTSSLDVVRFCPLPFDKNHQLAFPQARTSTSDWSTASSNDTSCSVVEQPSVYTASTNYVGCFYDCTNPAGFGWETGSAEFPSISQSIGSDLKRQDPMWWPFVIDPGQIAETG